MNTDLRIKRDSNPRKNAGFLSKVFFCYTYKTFGKGYKDGLNEENIYEKLDYNAAAALGDRLETLWKIEARKQKPCILKPLFKMFWLEYVVLGLGVFTFETILFISQPILMGRVIAYFEHGQTEITRNEALLYAAGLVGCILIWRIFDNNYLFLLGQLSMRIRIACCSLMYRKCLKLNSSTTPQSEYGSIVTMMTKDVTQFNGATDMLHVICEGVLQMMIMTYLMYRQMGVATFSGVSLLIVILIFHVFLGKLTAVFRLRTAGKTDRRVRVTQEILTAIRIIKMYSWERFFSKCVSQLRRKEINSLRILFIIKALTLSVGELSGILAFYVCVMTYVSLGHSITAERAYIVLGCFATLRDVLTVKMPSGITQIAELVASIERITRFLHLDEVEGSVDFQEDKLQQPRISVKKAGVKSKCGKDILHDIDIDIISGITLITGIIGCGKSTLLNLLIGDAKEDSGTVEISGAVSYAAEEPWVFPGTIKQNILFGQKFSEKRYKTVLDVCALDKDLRDFPLGDMTCVTDRGLNLSRGQKARINLARAVYKKADIYLFDDCLSSVDSHVANHIFTKCFKEFLQHSIRILVSHQPQFLDDVDTIIILDGGKISFQGKYKDFLKIGCNQEVIANIANKNEELVQEIIVSNSDQKPLYADLDDTNENSKLLPKNDQDPSVYKETREIGSVKMGIYYRYLAFGGGVGILILVLLLSIATQTASSWSDVYISIWVNTEQGLYGFKENGTTSSVEYKKLEDTRGRVLMQYSALVLAAAVLTLLRAVSYFIFNSNVSIRLHKAVLETIINAGMKFFDANLSGNIINRFTRDLAIIDEQTAFVIFDYVRSYLSLFAVLFVVSTVNVLFLIPSIIFGIILYLAQKLYLPTGRSIRRLEGTTRSPLIGHISATLEGLTTIRASRSQKILLDEFDKCQDVYNSVSYMNLATARTFIFYLESLSALFMTAVILTFLFHNTDTLSGQVGLAISQTFTLTSILQFAVRQWVELETQMTSTERILEYTTIESENKLGNTIKNWPTSGRIVYQNVNLQYSPTSEIVLKDVSFVIEPKRTVAIVGRTGAGKTSIISSLFRLYEYNGKIIIDGIDITSLKVEVMRSKISIITQEPVLFFGTLRSNIDPNEEYSDETLWTVLEEVGMKSLITDLYRYITDGGSNFSTGQRQLFCLARAIISRHAILVLDEATANVDPQTDWLIHKTIQRKFKNCTVISILHRLNYILDYDKVLVMDSGRVIEYDSPKILLKNKSGALYNMVKESELL